MADSPRERRLRNDFAAIQKLQSESTILDFTAVGALPEAYTLIFRGVGVWKPDHHPDVLPRDEHQVVVRLGAGYPRMMPELIWKTPIFHPNISSSGVVCLGGYGSYWAPSVTLDELCTMLWDMIRYKNFDPDSPYNRQAAIWAKHQGPSRFPLDPRPIRNKVAATTPSGAAITPAAATTLRASPFRAPTPPRAAAMHAPVEAEIIIAEVIDEGPAMNGPAFAAAGASPVVSRPPSGDILIIE
jgi:hypothetical protein